MDLKKYIVHQLMKRSKEEIADLLADQIIRSDHLREEWSETMKKDPIPDEEIKTPDELRSKT